MKWVEKLMKIDKVKVEEKGKGVNDMLFRNLQEIEKKLK